MTAGTGPVTFPWLSNYIAGRNHGRTRDYAFEVSNLAMLARGIDSLIDERRIKGDIRLEKLCRFAYRRMTRVADWMRIVVCPPQSQVALLKRVQRRIEGLNISSIQRDTEKLNKLDWLLGSVR